jgi:hypothetical protein
MKDMARIDLDPQTAARLVEGGAGDLPPELGGVAAVLEAARRAATESDLSGLEVTVAAMQAAIGAQPTAVPAPAANEQTWRPPSLLPRLLSAGVAGVAVLFGSLAAAGALPSVAQRPVADIVSHVGIDLPRPASNSGGSERKVQPTATSTTSTSALPGDTTGTTSPTSETTVPPCVATFPSPSNCIRPVPPPEVPTTSSSTTSTTKPPPPTTTTTTTAPAPGSGPSSGKSAQSSSPSGSV